MAEHRPRTATQDSRHPAPVLAQLSPTDRVHTGVDPMQPALLDAVVDRTGAEPEIHQLLPRYDPMLLSRERPYRLNTF